MDWGLIASIAVAVPLGILATFALLGLMAGSVMFVLGRRRDGGIELPCKTMCEQFFEHARVANASSDSSSEPGSAATS